MNKENLTKKERRQIRKEEKKQEKKMMEKRSGFTKWLIGGLILIIVGIGFWKTSSSSENKIVIEERKKGLDNSSIVITEFSDFQCPACALNAVILKQVVERYGDQVKIVYKHFPLISIHHNALSGARAAEAAGQQGKFWEMHDLLFKNQDEWSEERKAYDKFVVYAESLGLDLIQFEQDYNNKAILAKVNSERGEALKLKLRGTPTFFINDELIDNPGSLAGWETLLKNYGLVVEASGEAVLK